jgi:DNA polymerase
VGVPAPTRSAADFLPARRSLPALRDAARRCRGCDLYLRGTQTVFGEGARGARALFVGEQPGDVEDLEGRPFVGPAGRLLDAALAEVGIARELVYLTNAVKHFKWVAKGRRRIHQKPSATEVKACLPWLAAEVEVVRPDALVLLGATAAQAVMGPKFRVTRQRGLPLDSPFCPWTLATWHPSALLRMPDEAKREQARGELLADLARVAARLRALAVA